MIRRRSQSTIACCKPCEAMWVNLWVCVCRGEECTFYDMHSLTAGERKTAVKDGVVFERER